ncbi:Imm59 family immunity protein, partial [Streptococcus sp. HMSC072D07]
MKNLDKEKQDLLSAIHDLGYESLRYSIFNEYGPREWEVVIEYDDFKQVYNVYATMDRASYNKKLEFDNFEAAKNKFLEKLDLTVEINKLFVENGESPEYSSPLWDKIEAKIENMKCIVEHEIKKRHFESLHYVLFDETKQLPWAFHLYQKNG